MPATGATQANVAVLAVRETTRKSVGVQPIPERTGIRSEASPAPAAFSPRRRSLWTMPSVRPAMTTGDVTAAAVHVAPSSSEYSSAVADIGGVRVNDTDSVPVPGETAVTVGGGGVAAHRRAKVTTSPPATRCCQTAIALPPASTATSGPYASCVGSERLGDTVHVPVAAARRAPYTATGVGRRRLLRPQHERVALGIHGDGGESERPRPR